jgi:cytochrome b pre-mRNA-processing protein 3
MFRRLFAGLTGEPKRGQALFRLAVAEASRPSWFVEGEVPDTVNGRFAVLATIVALMTLRLEAEGEDGKRASAALAERLVESLDTEIREMGVGDPALGKQVRGLVGSVAGRVERWRNLLDSAEPWTAEVRRSLYLDEDAPSDAVAASESALRNLWQRLGTANVEDLENGRIG